MTLNKNNKKIWKICVTAVILILVVTFAGVWYFCKPVTHQVVDEYSQHYIGRFLMPDVDIDVGLYEFERVTQEDDDKMKNAMDEEDVAVEFWGSCKGSWFIADHNYQGFRTLSKCEVEDIAYINQNDGTQQQYQVVKKFKGENSETELTQNGRLIAGDNPGGIIVYTCASRWNTVDVWIVFLQPVND